MGVACCDYETVFAGSRKELVEKLSYLALSRVRASHSSGSKSSCGYMSESFTRLGSGKFLEIGIEFRHGSGDDSRACGGVPTKGVAGLGQRWYLSTAWLWGRKVKIMFECDYEGVVMPSSLITSGNQYEERIVLDLIMFSELFLTSIWSIDTRDLYEASDVEESVLAGKMFMGICLIGTLLGFRIGWLLDALTLPITGNLSSRGILNDEGWTRVQSRDAGVA